MYRLGISCCCCFIIPAFVVLPRAADFVVTGEGGSMAFMVMAMFGIVCSHLFLLIVGNRMMFGFVRAMVEASGTL